jgi:cellulose synthase/poly-beta-1,6-N-acetylglucosamine synthase-like glycosyltransferase
MQRITIGIPSFNEEKNITNLLSSLVQHNAEDFSISEVIISDDSYDKTPQLVDTIVNDNKYPLNIKLIHHSQRRGAGAAWNEIFEKSSGDIIVLYDADVIIDRNCTEQLVSSIKGKVGLCAANPVPVPIRGVVGRASIFTSNWLRAIRKRVLSQYTVMGRALSLRSDLAKKIRIPQDIIAIDLYLQCKVLEYGLDIAYNDNAVVYFRPANTVSDFTSQVIRASNGHKQIWDHVSKFRINLSPEISIIETIRNAISNPAGAISTILCYAVIPYYKIKLKNTGSAKWQTAISTKALDYSQQPR